MIIVDIVKNNLHFEEVRAGSSVFREGDQGDYMYVVAEGEVDLIKQGEPLRTVKPGGLFGEMALIDGSPRSADAVARTDCVLAPVDERRFLFLVHETPMFALEVMKVMAERLRE